LPRQTVAGLETAGEVVIVDLPSSDLLKVGPKRRSPRARSLTPYLFLAIPVVLLVVLTYVPMVETFALSLYNWDGFGQSHIQFVGLQNYFSFFTDPAQFGVLFVSLYYLVGAFVQLALALYLATLLSSRTRFRNLFKGVIFFPYLLNGVAISFIFLYFFRPGGVLDSFTSIFGADPNNNPLWLGDRSLINISLTFVSVWRYMGLNFILFLGAIQSIPPETLEAAQMDGANKWQELRYIIIPGIRPIIALSLILAIAGSLSVFEIPYIMEGGANGSATFVIETVNTAFKYHQYGLATAMAAILLVLILLVTWAQRRLIHDEPVELI
jgi:raffinose/stachyose/melibiose transport system permease protein